MTIPDIKGILGISEVRHISETETVIELPSGHAHPATTLEARMWEFIKEHFVA